MGIDHFLSWKIFDFFLIVPVLTAQAMYMYAIQLQPPWNNAMFFFDIEQFITDKVIVLPKCFCCSRPFQAHYLFIVS